MSCFMEIMHYVLKQLITDRLSEDESFANFKELLLRHAIQRPPHSLAIFSLADVKLISEFALDTFFRHFDMYKYALTERDMLLLQTTGIIEDKVPGEEDAGTVGEGEVDGEEGEGEKELAIEDMANGPAKIEAILNQEMASLMAKMEEKIKQ